MDSFASMTHWFSWVNNGTFTAALLKSLITVVCVATVLWFGRKFGDRVSGILAGLPIVTAPTLIWLATRDAPDFAIRAAVNAMSATAAYAFFALIYAHLCGYFRARVCLIVAFVFSLFVAALFVSIPATRTQTLVITLLICGAIRWFMPDPSQIVSLPATVPPKSGSPVRVPIWVVAINAGAVCGAIVYFSAYIPAHWVGMLASVPIIGATVAFATHQRIGVPAARSGLIGYVEGCAVKILFCFVFAQSLRSEGLVMATLYAVLVCAVVVILMNARSYLPQKSDTLEPQTAAVGVTGVAGGNFTRVRSAPTPATTSW